MGTIIVILNALKIDQTSLIQFGILFVVFNFLAVFLFKRVQEILELRESKTTKLETNTHAVYKKAEELEEQYRAHVEKTHQDAHIKSSKMKNDILDSEKNILKEAEDKINAEYESKRVVLLKEISDKKQIIMAEADKLSIGLVEKLTK